MRTVLAALVILGVAEQTPGRLVALSLPHALENGDAVWLRVTVGELSRGSEIIVSTKAGRVVGIISPFGTRSGRESGVYTVPIPSDAITDGRISLRLAVDQSGKPRRAATFREVKDVKVTITHPKR